MSQRVARHCGGKKQSEHYAIKIYKNQQRSIYPMPICWNTPSAYILTICTLLRATSSNSFFSVCLNLASQLQSAMWPWLAEVVSFQPSGNHLHSTSPSDAQTHTEYTEKCQNGSAHNDSFSKVYWVDETVSLKGEVRQSNSHALLLMRFIDWLAETLCLLWPIGSKRW